MNYFLSFILQEFAQISGRVSGSPQTAALVQPAAGRPSRLHLPQRVLLGGGGVEAVGGHDKPVEVGAVDVQQVDGGGEALQRRDGVALEEGWEDWAG